MKPLFTFGITVRSAALACLLLSTSLISSAQTSIKEENFDGTIGSLPSGWVASPATGGWMPDTATANRSAGYTAASGMQNIVIKNASGLSGTYNLVSNPVTTVGFHNITILWGARNTTHFADSGSTISGFEWSSDGGNNWNPLSYVQNASNSTWSLVNTGTRISLPASSEGQTAVIFRWVASLHGNPSGTYRIDDFSVMGTSTTGVTEELKANPNDAKVAAFFEGISLIIRFNNFRDEPVHVDLFDITGKKITSFLANSSLQEFPVPSIQPGVYFVRATSGKKIVVSKIVFSK